MNEEREALTARMAELDDNFCAGSGSPELEAEFYAADSRVRELAGLIYEAGRPKRRGCANTLALVSANID